MLPTYNRAEALRRNLPRLLAIAGIAEVIVVDDGSRDATSSVLERCPDRRLRVLRQARNCGTPLARNLGADAARSPWILFAEDDCLFPADFATVLLADALAHDADIASAPMVHVSEERQLPRAIRRARAAPRPPTLDGIAGFVPRPTTTPLLQAPALVNARVLRQVRFDPGYRGNAYREETDFYIRAWCSGFRTLLTPRTYFWEQQRFSGGHQRGRLPSLYWDARNNWRFLTRHDVWLRQHGLIRSRWSEQAAFLGRRAQALAAA